MENGLENIDEVFKQTFKGFEANVNPSVWNNVQQSITSGNGGANTTPKVDPSAASGVVVKSMVMKIVAGVILVGSVATAGYFIVDNVNNNDKKNIIVENNIPVPTNNTVIPEQKTDNLVLTNNEASATEKDIIDQKDESNYEPNPTINTNKVERKRAEVTNPVSSDNNQEEITNHNNNADSKADNITDNSDVSKTSTEDDKTVNQAVVIDDDNNKDNQSTVSNKPADPVIFVENTPKEKPIKIKDIPKAFSPNGDGINDVIKIEGENIKIFKASILKNNGDIVYEWDSPYGFWDGRDMSGNLLPEGAYFLVLKVTGENGKFDVRKKLIQLYR